MRALFIVTSVMACLCLAAPAMAQADQSLDMTIEGLKSRDAAERKDAVARLVGLRVAVGRELRHVVDEANAGRSSDEAKTLALYLMGYAGLADCMDVVEREKEWMLDASAVGQRPHGLSLLLTIGGPKRDPVFSRQPAAAAVEIVKVSPAVTVVQAPETDLAKYPALAASFGNLASRDEATWREAFKTVKEWQSTVVAATEGMLDEHMRDLYPNEVRVAALYVWGEYRPLGNHDFTWAADVEDKSGESAGYAATMSAQGADARYPITAAIIKAGPRLSVNAVVGKLERIADDAARARVASAIVAAGDPQAARHSYTIALRKSQESRKTTEAARLQSVGHILAP